MTQLATVFGIVTPYTSYLVVEPGANIRRTRPRPTPRPMDRPIGTRPSSGFGARGAGSGGGGMDLGVVAGAPGEGAMDDFEFEEAAPATKAAPRKGMRARVAKTRRSKRDKKLKADSGADAVATAKDIGRLQRSEAKEREALTTIRRALGREFVFSGGFFVDETVKKGDKTLQIRPYSDAFFSVLRLRPDLKQALMLGDFVQVRVGRGKTLVVSPSAPKTVAAKKLEAFVKK